MQIIEKKIGELIPYAKNPRRNDPAVGPVAESIKQFGFKVPIIIDRGNVIVAGHTRLKAAKRLGLKKVPCVVADDLTPEQVKAFRLADNRVGEFAAWDQELLSEELAGLFDYDLSALGFDLEKAGDWFLNRERFDTSRQEGNEEYNTFLDKFEDPKTTDDCYTPDLIYDAVADYVAEHYHRDRSSFVRPFYPGGDYEAYKYPAGCCVVDNPPFSILSKIVRFYQDCGVRFFLFAPAVSLLTAASSGDCCAVCAGVSITYENGANVHTSFLTNLDEGLRLRTAPELHKRVQAADDEVQAAMRKPLPKYEYPDEVLTASRAAYMSKYGQEFQLRSSECVKISELDAMKESGKGIFGSGLLLSEKAAAEKAAAEKAAAEKAAAEKWKLSPRERKIVKSLGRG